MYALPGTALLTVVLAAQSPAPVADDGIPTGKAELAIQAGPVELQVFTYRPESWTGDRILLVLHGVLRNAEQYRDRAIGMADRFDALLFTPCFDADRFPSRAYQRGGLLRSDRTPAPAEEWTYARIPELAAEIRKRSGRPDAGLYILGHSAGGQFVVRMSAFQDTGAVRLVAVNPGSVLMPTRDAPFGYGFGGLPQELSDDRRIRAYLAAPLTLYLGTADDRPDEHFDQSRAAMVQGAGRHQRGLALYWTARTLAAERGWDFGWRLVEAPGVGHNSSRMFDHENCALALFGEVEVPGQEPRQGR